MNKYAEMIRQHQAEFNKFPMFFAFSDSRFAEGMEKLGLKPSDTDKIYRMGNTGGFYRKSDSGKLRDMTQRHKDELKQAIAEDKDGTDFAYDMFYYELQNHEYCITLDVDDAISACGFTPEEVTADKILSKALGKAATQVLRDSENY